MPRRTLYPLVSIDVALFSVEADELQVLLVQRANEPLLHSWALPGGLLQPERDENLEAAAARVLTEKLDVKIAHLGQVATFSGAKRDPRGWSVGVLYYALLPRNQIEAAAQTKVARVAWVPAYATKHDLAFDHADQLRAATALLRARVERGDMPLHLLGPEFTLTQLQRTCAAILQRALDKSVFRRQIKDLQDLVPTGTMTEGGRQRPAQLFRAREGFRWD